MMISAVILAFAVATSTLALPLTTQEHIIGGVENLPQTQEVPVHQNVEKSGVQSSPEIFSSFQQQNTPVTKVENVPVNVEQPQANYPENPVLLPIQPLSVSQVSQVFRPIIIPAEAITDGRVIITASEPIQQRSFQQVESITPYEQTQTHAPVEAGVEPQQLYNVQPVEKQTPVQQEVTQGQTYTQNQEPLIREYTVSVNQVEQQTVPVANYNPAEPNVQVYNIPQSVQPVVAENPEKYQIPSEYTPVHQQQVEPANHQYEGYTGQPIVVENVEKQVQTQQSSEYQQQVYNQQLFEKHAGYQQLNTHTPVENQPVQQVAYNVEPAVEKQGQCQLAHTPVHTQAVEPQQQVQQPVEKQAYHQQPVQVHTQTFEPEHQELYNLQPVEQVQHQISYQQVYSVDPAAVGKVENQASVQTPVQYAAEPVQQVYNVQPVEQVPYQQATPLQTSDFAPGQISKTSAVEPQVYNVQVPQAVNLAGEPTNTAAENLLQQNTQVQTLSVVEPLTQSHSVQPSVVSTQE